MINLMTAMRVVLLVPLAFLLLATHAPSWTAVGIFALAGVTDFLDGWLARRLGKTSAFGAMLDQISDKILIVGVLVALAAAGLLQNLMLVPVFLIIAREFFVAGLREYAAQQGRAIPVDPFGKLKTTLQFLSIALILIPGQSAWFFGCNHIGAALLWIAALLGFISAVRYAVSAAASRE